MTLVKFSTAPAKTFVPEYRNAYASRTRPAVNVSESAEGFEIELAAPGLSREDFNLKVEGDLLTISAQKNSAVETSENTNYHRREFSYASFERSFRLPDIIDTQSLKASYNQGILRVEMAFKPETKPVVRTIEVV